MLSASLRVHSNRLPSVIIAMLLLFGMHQVLAQDSSSINLLPTPLGPMEKMMWSEHGAMRILFDFPLTENGREEELRLRRTLLGLHQVGGFVTLAALAGTMVLGQSVYNGNRDYRQMHKAMAFTTVGAYFTTASLSLFTPPPYIRRKEWSSISTHRLLGYIHFGGMVAMPVLGTLIRQGHTDLRPAHLAMGYTTLAALSAAMLVVTF